MTVAPDRSDVVEAVDAAVSWWHQNLDEEIADHTNAGGHPDRPTTAREYFRQQRRFDDETIDAWRLGWAPAGGGLYDHLSEEGFSDEIISATGLFCEKAPEKELWRGRYVFPYFAPDGTADYAIARTTGSKGGGDAGYDGHPTDFLAGKYAKIAHTRDNVPLSEPILGRHTLSGAEEVVVAEGIADAITANEAGYAVLSPVTKEFKREHFDAVVAAVEDHDIGRVYVVPDAELAGFAEIDSDDVPDEPENIYEAVNIPTVAPGPGGGLRTANYLREEGIDARLVELPRPSAGKVDLDDYLQGWVDDLGAGLASAKPPQQHPKYEAATATQTVDDDAPGNVSNSVRSDKTADTTRLPSGAGGLYALDLDDVNRDLTEGYRGKNPLGHTGDSENYFVVRENPQTGDLIATDYKRPGQPRYNALTYLLVEIGERPVEGPMGDLTAKETWEAWAEARQRGLLDADGVIPAKALEHIARDRGLYDFEALPEEADLPPKAHNRALGWVLNQWADQTLGLDGGEEATARDYYARDGCDPRTWEDVRYIYDGDKKEGRQAAEGLLRSKYEFITKTETDELFVYDPETGVFTDELSKVKSELHDPEAGDGLGEHWTRHEKDEIFARLRQQNRVEETALNAGALDKPHVCVRNGVLDLYERELLPHSPEYYFVDRVPATYDPDADTEPYDEFLSSLVERDADRKALEEMVGHALVPDAYERGWKLFLMLTGDTDNGKSVFYDRVQSLLNGPSDTESNTAHVKLSKIAENRFSNRSIEGKLANIAGEVDGKKIRNTASLKDITGGDSVEIEPKGGESYFAHVNSTMMFAANDPPIIGNRDKEAIAERLVPVELPYKFVDDPSGSYEKQKIPEEELKDELDTEEALSGFLNLALDGVQRLRQNGGDVSLPESHQERLRQYERNADPMREFGERCLTNDDADYLVKADVTTLYKEFATAKGHEVSQNVGRTLHDVLRGVPDLNYTDSRPESPDYTDTNLPLRGWNERKRVINRTTLTEEGLELARDAGLIEDAPEPGTPDYLTAGEAEASDRVGGREKMPPVRGALAAVWEDRYGDLVGELVDDDGSIDLRFQGNWSLPEDLPVSEGNEYEFEGLRHRDPDGERAYFEVRPTTAVERLNDGADSTGDDGDDDDPQPADATDGDSGATAAADGGHVDDVENVAPKVVMAVSELDGTGDYPDGVPPEAIKEYVDATEEEVEHGIEKATQDGTLYQPTSGKYRPT